MDKCREEEDKQLFNRISEKYAKKDIYPVSKLARAFQISCMIDFLSTEYNIDRAANVLEVGCGHGANSEYFQNLYVHYLGIDYSEELINIALNRYGNKKTNFVVDNIKDLNKHGKFDLVIGVGVLHHVDDVEKALLQLKKVGHDDTVYLFYEPQRGNPFIQILRKLRIIVDPSYSGEQVFFEKQELTNIVSNLGFRKIKSRYCGYFTPPFAQVMLKPSFMFKPLANLSVQTDRFLFTKVNNRAAWNFVIAFTK